jgi:hypothetical protein
MANGDAERVRKIIVEQYGFTPSRQYCADLIAFVEALYAESRK